MQIRQSLFALLFFSGAVFAKELPPDIKRFISNAEACEHFAGEFDSSLSAKRRRDIERAVIRYCQTAQRQLKQLNAKYTSDAELTETLRQHANDSVTSFRGPTHQ